MKIKKISKFYIKNNLKNCKGIDNLTEKIEVWNCVKERSLNIATVFVREF